MSVRPSRLRISDWLLGASSLALIVVLFGLDWYQVKPQFRSSLLVLGERVTANGWQVYTWIGPLCVIVAALGILYAVLQATRRAPALPVLTVIVLTPFSWLLSVALVVRVLLARPSLVLPGGQHSALQVCDGAYAGLGLALIITVCGWLSLRREGIDPHDSPLLIETLTT